MFRFSPTSRRRGTKVLVSLSAATLVSSSLIASTTSTAIAAPKPRASVTAYGDPILRVGSTGSAVLSVQRKLRVKPTSGYFGPVTRSAVKRFQKSKGIKSTGVVAELTWSALKRSGVKVAKAKPKAKAKAKAKKPKTQSISRAQRVLNFAAKLQGIPYKSAGFSPKTGFNCSSYTQYVYQNAIGKNLGGAYTVTQYNAAKKISRSQAKPGDLVFFHDYPKNFLGHVGIYAGNNKYWHAPRPGRVVSLDTFYTNKLKFARVL